MTKQPTSKEKLQKFTLEKKIKVWLFEGKYKEIEVTQGFCTALYLNINIIYPDGACGAKYLFV